MYPPVSIVIPWDEKSPLFIPEHDPEDEVIVVTGEKPIGIARLEGALKAKHDWIVFTDSDAYYPPDYISKVKEKIRSGLYPNGFRTTRKGGFGMLNRYLESGLIVRKSYLLSEIGKCYIPASNRSDIMMCGHLKSLPVLRDVWYYHGFTKGEVKTLVTIGAAATGALLTCLPLIQLISLSGTPSPSI